MGIFHTRTIAEPGAATHNPTHGWFHICAFMTTARTSREKARRVFLLDDHPLVREWLASMIALESDLEVCGQADEASVALNTLHQTRPDIVVVDLSLPRSSGLEFIKQMRAQHPAIRLLVLSMHDEATVAERAFRAGAHGYAVKREAGTQIIEGVRTVLEGKFYASPSLTAQLAGRMFGGKSERTERLEEVLSDREMEVFRLRGKGFSAKEIADHLSVSVKTVGSYDARIKEKLGLDNAGELMREAVLWQDRQRGL
jgi:DNA-binding NarL/FixJ family response regulator